MNFFKLTLVLLSLVLMSEAKLMMDSEFIQYTGAVVPMSPLDSWGARSIVECAALCLQNPDCTRYAFNVSDVMCYVYGQAVGVSVLGIQFATSSPVDGNVLYYNIQQKTNNKGKALLGQRLHLCMSPSCRSTASYSESILDYVKSSYMYIVHV